jgi:hypothetical protein
MEYYFLLNILSLLSIISDMDKNIKLKFDENNLTLTFNHEELTKATTH